MFKSIACMTLLFWLMPCQTEEESEVLRATSEVLVEIPESDHRDRIIDGGIRIEMESTVSEFRPGDYLDVDIFHFSPEAKTDNSSISLYTFWGRGAVSLIEIEGVEYLRVNLPENVEGFLLIEIGCENLEDDVFLHNGLLKMSDGFESRPLEFIEYQAPLTDNEDLSAPAGEIVDFDLDP